MSKITPEQLAKDTANYKLKCRCQCDVPQWSICYTLAAGMIREYWCQKCGEHLHVSDIPPVTATIDIVKRLNSELNALQLNIEEMVDSLHEQYKEMSTEKRTGFLIEYAEAFGSLKADEFKRMENFDALPSDLSMFPCGILFCGYCHSENCDCHAPHAPADACPSHKSLQVFLVPQPYELLLNAKAKLSVRTKRILANLKIHTFGELANSTEEDLRRGKGCGTIMVQEVRNFLIAHGLKLKKSLK